MGFKKKQPEWVFFIVCACFSLLFSQVIFSESLDTIARKICGASGKMKKKQIAVLPFPYHDGAEGSDSTIIAEKLITRIVSRKKFDVVERALLEKVLAELKLQHSGAIDQETAKKLGSVLGVEALLTGTLIDLGNGHIEINARLINAETGLVLAAADEEIQRSWKEDAKLKKPEETAQDVQSKMAVFFHPREYRDPRFYSEDGTARPVPQQNPNAMVLSNKKEYMAAKLDGEERMVDAPNEWNRADGGKIRVPAENFSRIQSAWEHLNRNDLDKTTAEFSKLCEDLNGDPRAAALAQLYLAEGYFKQGRYQDAFREAKQSMRRTGIDRVKAQATYLMARAQEEMGKFGIAAGFYRDILQNYPYESRMIRQSGQRMRIHARKRP